MRKFPKGCLGCVITQLYAELLLDPSREYCISPFNLIDKTHIYCPCTTCLIKVVCKIPCDKFIEIKENLTC
ncbi:MAG: hypothetical protein ACFFG0_00045 [Candidatus Thorarchaeota archaeon]